MGTKTKTETTTPPNVNPWEIESIVRKKLKEGIVLEDGDFVAINIDRHVPIYLRITRDEMFVRHIYGARIRQHVELPCVVKRNSKRILHAEGRP